MGFNISNGLSAMGGAIAQTAGAASLEMQRQQLEEQKMALADQLAARRDSDSRIQQADINDKASTKEQTFKAGESVLNRQHEDEMLDTRESGDDRRLSVTEAGANKRAAMSEGSANKRFDEEMQFRISQAKEATQDHKEKQVLDSAIAASTSTSMESYTTADGSTATRPVKTFNPTKASSILNNAGYPDLAKPFTVPKAKAAALPSEGTLVKQDGHTFKVTGGKYVLQD